MSNVGIGKNVMIFNDHKISSVHIDNENKEISIVGSVSTQVLGDTTLNAEGEYSTNFTKQENRFCLSLHYNEKNSYSFVNIVKIYQFKAKYYKLIHL